MKSHESGKIDRSTSGENGDGGDATRGVQNRYTGFAGLGRLEAAVSGDGRRMMPPVEKWNPPYCGDIGLAIAGDGTWFYQGSPIRRMELVKLFASVLRRDEDGRHYLVTPVEKIDIAVADAPLLAVEMDVLGSGRDQSLVMRTNLDDVMRIGPEHVLRFAPSLEGVIRPYVGVRGRIEALVTRALTYELAELLTQDHRGRTGVWSEGAFFALE